MQLHIKFLQQSLSFCIRPFVDCMFSSEMSLYHLPKHTCWRHWFDCFLPWQVINPIMSSIFTCDSNPHPPPPPPTTLPTLFWFLLVTCAILFDRSSCSSIPNPLSFRMASTAITPAEKKRKRKGDKNLEHNYNTFITESKSETICLSQRHIDKNIMHVDASMQR